MGRRLFRGLCRICLKEGKEQFINKEGKAVLSGHWSDVTEFRDGFAAVKDYDSEKIGIINSEGKLVVDYKIEGSLRKNLGNGYFTYYKSKTGYAMSDATGKVIFDNMKDIDYGDGLFTVLDKDNILNIYDSDLNQVF